jgi:hypothetical protein
MSSLAVSPSIFSEVYVSAGSVIALVSKRALGCCSVTAFARMQALGFWSVTALVNMQQWLALVRLSE